MTIDNTLFELSMLYPYGRALVNQGTIQWIFLTPTVEEGSLTGSLGCQLLAGAASGLCLQWTYEQFAWQRPS